MRQPLLRWGRRLRVDVLFRAVQRRRLLVLMYHGLVEQALSPFCWWQLPRTRFAEQMQWLRSRYHVLPLDQALRGLASGDLPDHACAITFDDGYRSVRTLALPVLQALELPATVFVVTGLTGRDEPLWPDRVWQALAGWSARELDLRDLGLGRRPVASPAARDAAIADVLEALKAMSPEEKDCAVEALVSDVGGASTNPDADAFTRMDWAELTAASESGLLQLGAHSLTHEILRQCSDADVERQVIQSVTELTARVPERARVETFAYPNGRPQDIDARAMRAVAHAGLSWGLTTRSGLARPADDPFALPRVGVGADVDLGRFRLLCAGI